MPRIAASPYLANLSRLTVNPLGTDPQAYRAIVSEPTWSHLKVLRLTGRLSPGNVRGVATGCTLRHLEEVELELGNPGILGDPIIQAAAAGLQSFVRMIGLAVTVPATAHPGGASTVPRSRRSRPRHGCGGSEYWESDPDTCAA